jgi:hypothetical protein
LKFYLRSLSKRHALRLARYALVNPKPSTLRVVKKPSKLYFGIYTIEAQEMKLDRLR